MISPMQSKTREELYTCQVCGRQVKAKSGVIAHHGYKRPYEGWQTPSCQGARYVPYEESYERLKEVCEQVKDLLERTKKRFEEFQNNPPQEFTVLEKKSSWDRQGTEVTYQKPEGFDPKYNYAAPRSYGGVYQAKKSEFVMSIRAMKGDITSMERRIKEWKKVSHAS